MLTTVMHAPMSFFDTTPLGRVIARFSKDQNTLDKQLPESLNTWALWDPDQPCGILTNPAGS